MNAAVGNGGSLLVEVLDMHDGSLIVNSEPITTSITDGVGKANLVWSRTFPHWKSRHSCVLKFVVAGDVTVFSFVPAKS